MWKIWLSLAVLATLATAPAREAQALSCGFYTGERMDLSLEQVTEDGVTVMDLSGYDGFQVFLEGSSSDRFRLFAMTGENATWLEEYQ